MPFCQSCLNVIVVHNGLNEEIITLIKLSTINFADLFNSDLFENLVAQLQRIRCSCKNTSS